MKNAILLLLIFTALIFSPMFFEQFETPKAWCLITFASLTCFGLSYRQIFKDKITLGLFLFIVSTGLSTIFSIDRHMSFWGNPGCPNGLLTNASYFIFYLACCQTFTKGHTKPIDAIIFSALIVALYAIAQSFGLDFMEWKGVLHEGKFMRPPSTMGHPNFMAGYLAMVLPFVIRRTELRRCWVSLTISVILGVAIILSQSRGVWLSALCGCLTLYFLTNAQLKSIMLKIMAMGLLFGVVFFANKEFRDGASYRLPAIFSPGGARLYYPTVGLHTWLKHPILGAGTDTFEITFDHERNAAYWGYQPAGSPTRAHCELINILATQGLLGGLCVIFLTLAIIERLRKYRIPAASASIVVFYVMNISGFTTIATGVLFMLVLSFINEEICERY